jgi:HK97 family phage major capsid protein
MSTKLSAREEADLLEKAIQAIQKQGMQPASNATGTDLITRERVPAQAIDRSVEGMWGFKSFADFANEVRHSGRTLNDATERLRTVFGSDTVKKAATGMGELVGSDGGFLVPPSFSQKIFERVYKNNDLLSRTDKYPCAGNSVVFPRNAESSRANGSRWGGVRAYWTQEGSTGTRSAPTFGRHTLILHKLMCLAAVTDELLADYPALDGYLTRVFSDEINFVVGDALVNGTGAGQPLGILNAACTVSVAKETGQTAATIVTQNIVKMWARMFRGMAQGENSGAAWFVNQDTAPQLQTMTVGVGTGGVVTYMPPGGLSDKPYATLMGAPVIEIEWCSTLGTVGDIILADMNQVVSISKTMESATSMHLYFDSDQTAFRTTFRLDAQPWWATALTPFKGTNTQSCLVTLATRA